MKNLIALLFVFVVATFSFSQDKVVVVKSAKDVASLRENGKGLVFLPAGLKKEEVEDRAKYYVKYFTVEYTSSTGATKIEMIDNTDRSRGVIRRFFVANDIRTIQVDGKTMELDAFFDEYVK